LPAGKPADIRPLRVACILRSCGDLRLSPELAVSTTIGPYLPSLLSSARSAYATAPAAGSANGPGDEASAASQEPLSATVTLSDAAKAYLASPAETDIAVRSLATLAADARAWFDQQYRTLGIKSAMLDGQVAVDLTGQSRATLSAVAADAGEIFSDDESEAARIALQSRLDDALAPHVVIARHTRDYAGLYKAASDYLDKAGEDERATEIWQDQRQAVAKGLAAAKAAPARAPDTGDKNDPVHALLGKTSADGSPLPGTDTGSVASKARTLLDAQENKARDNGTQLQLDPRRTTGQPIDFSGFDNRTLATVVLNPEASFSDQEARAAKGELDRRVRQDMLATTSTGDGGLGLLRIYGKMSVEEKAVMGVTTAVTDRVIQNYQTLMSLQNAVGGSGLAAGAALPGLSAYL
jgi:hypothetical protein